jgi:hypothetical protein
MENRQYMIFNISEVDSINFDEVLQTSAETLRKSNDNTKALVKWEGMTMVNPLPTQLSLDENGQPIELPPFEESTVEDYIPASIKALTTKEGPYTHTEILSILSGPNWTNSNPTS